METEGLAIPKTAGFNSLTEPTIGLADGLPGVITFFIFGKSLVIFAINGLNIHLFYQLIGVLASVENPFVQEIPESVFASSFPFLINC